MERTTYEDWVSGKLKDEDVTFVDIDIEVGSSRKVRGSNGQMPRPREVTITKHNADPKTFRRGVSVHATLEEGAKPDTGRSWKDWKFSFMRLLEEITKK